MSIRDRILAVYRGTAPSTVPYMLDLSHWFYHRRQMPWDLSRSYVTPERELIDYHKKMGVGFYLPNLAQFFTPHHRRDVRVTVRKRDHGRFITWCYETPLGTLERERRWEPMTYAWGTPSWPVRTEQDLRVLGYALSGMTFTPHWDRFQAWVDRVGQGGMVYLPTGYSGMGQILHYWAGVERTMYAVADWPRTMHEMIDQMNESNLQLIDLIATAPAEVVLMGDNFSSDVQPPHFFAEWSRPYYVEAIRRLHAAGKFVAVHVDGMLRGALRMIRDAGADCADATTPAPTGDLTPAQCRAEAGPSLILSGGVAPNLWLPDVDLDQFRRAVRDWLDLTRHGPRLIAAAGDQVPPGAAEDRIEIMRDLVEEYGRFD
ncbi:MAG: hypothetical protein A2W31_01475 [Planctomycetes bacterium RBG_16_64_10]|nr:MAG: hypothetical protein A2W31_01475 [Planctomycetes bacterium RBG_16_64_10]